MNQETDPQEPFSPPAGFQRHARSSPVTSPWEPLYARTLEDGSVHLGLLVREAHCNSRGFAHGGLISALADNAMGYSAVAQARKASPSAVSSGLTVSLMLDFIDVARIGDWLEIRPSVLKAGRTLSFVDCRVVTFRQGEEILIARGNANFRMV